MDIMQAIALYGKRELRFMDRGAERKEITAFEVLDKGCQLHVKNEKYPMRFHSAYGKVATVAQLKRIVPLILKGIKSKGILGIFVVLGIWAGKQIYIDWFHQFLSDVYPNSPDRYNQPVREFYRLIKNEKIRDIICAILEYESAYRYRAQDIFGELDKEAFEKNPYKEMKRLWGVLLERDVRNQLNNKGFKIEYLIWYLRMNRKLLKEIKQFVRDIDINEVKLSVEDIYWTNAGYEDYNFRGIDYATRQKEYELVKNS